MNLSSSPLRVDSEDALFDGAYILCLLVSDSGSSLTIMPNARSALSEFERRSFMSDSLY